MKNDFLTAYRAGKQAVDDWSEWKSALPTIVAVILWNVLEDVLITHYSLSRLKSFLISSVVVISAVFIFVRVKYAIRSRRNQQVKR